MAWEEPVPVFQPQVVVVVHPLEVPELLADSHLPSPGSYSRTLVLPCLVGYPIAAHMDVRSGAVVVAAAVAAADAAAAGYN